MPKVGMRMLKTAIAVFLCFIVYLFRENGIPFYSAIAAVLCIQQDMKNSKKQAKSRLISTLVGGILGIPVLWLLQEYKWLQVDVIHYMIVSIMIIPALYIPVLIKQPQSAYISCVVFMSITVSHIHDDNPFIFGVNRMIDTFIGIGIALLVNKITVHKTLNQHQSCCIIIQDNKDIESLFESYEAYHIQQLLRQKANITFVTPFHPSYMNTFTDYFHTDYYAFHGVLKYNSSTQLLECNTLLNTTLWQSIYEECRKKNMYPFVYTIRDGVLYTHYENLRCSIMKEIYDLTKVNVMYRYQFHKNIILELDENAVCLEFYIEEKNNNKVLELIKKYPNIQYIDDSYHKKYCIRVFAKQSGCIHLVEKPSVTFTYKKNKTLKDLYKLFYSKSLK